MAQKKSNYEKMLKKCLKDLEDLNTQKLKIEREIALKNQELNKIKEEQLQEMFPIFSTKIRGAGGEVTKEIIDEFTAFIVQKRNNHFEKFKEEKKNKTDKTLPEKKVPAESLIETAPEKPAAATDDIADADEDFTPQVSKAFM